MFIHNFASLKILVEEVDNSELEFGDEIEELSLDYLSKWIGTSRYSPIVRFSSLTLCGTSSPILSL